MKKLFVTIMHVAEIEVDDRISAADLEWATYQWDDCTDGRQSFSCELAGFAAKMVVDSFAANLRDGLASRICQKYPGANQNWYKLVALLPEFKVHYRIEESLMHCERGERVERVTISAKGKGESDDQA